MTTGEAIFRWLAVLLLFRLGARWSGRGLFGRPLELLGVPLLLFLTAYLYWLWGVFFRLPSVPYMAETVAVGLAFLLAAWAGRFVRAGETGKRKFDPAADVVFFVALVAALTVRSWMPEISGAEKFPDFSFFQGVFWDRQFPPQDRWLSGVPLNYYYFSQLLFVVPARLSGVPPETAYNLAIATIAALAAVVAFALGSAWSRRRGVGVAAALATVLLSNWKWIEGWSRGGRFFWWDSSRAIEGTITEFPFFSFLLGDLHPHYTSLPWMGLTLAAVAAFRSSERERAWVLGALCALLLGVHYPMNPWELPFLAAVAVLLWNAEPSRKSVLRTAAVGLGALLFFLPFWLSYERPVSTVVWVPRHLRSPLGEFLLHWGIFLVPLGGYLALSGGWRPGRRLWVVLGGSLAVAAGFGLSAGLIAGIAGLLWARDEVRLESVEDVLLIVSLAAIFLCEFVSLDATYGREKLLRLNTVFKFYTMAWWALALAVPLFLWRERERVARFRRPFVALLSAVLLASLFYPVAGVRSRVGGKFPAKTLDGMRFWELQLPGERPAAEWLRTTEPDDVIWEADGPAYGLHARMASFSGRPSVLGWANHQGVWRRNGWALVRPRQEEIALLKREPAPENLARFVAKYRVKWIVVGSLERKDYPPQLLELLSRLPVAFSAPGAVIYSAEAAIVSSSRPASVTE